MSRKIIVTGFLKTLSPLHISSPSSGRFNPETGKTTYTSERIGVPCTTVQKIGMPGIKTVNKEDQPDNGNETENVMTGGVTFVPVIPANNIAGHVRDCIGEVYLKALVENGQKVTITTESAIMTGAATGNPDMSPLTYEEYKRTEEHPFVGLLGGGPRMLNRRAKIHNAIALCNTSVQYVTETRIPYDMIYAGAWESIMVKHKADLESWNLTMTWGYRRNDDLKDLRNIAIAEASIADFVNAFNARQNQIIEEVGKNKDKAEGDKKSNSSVFTYQGLEFVMPHVSFPFVAVLDDVTDAQAGLWFRGFEQFCREHSLGGWSRNGFGEFMFCDGRITVIDDGELTETEPYSPGTYATSSDMNESENEETFRLKAITEWLAVAEKQTAEEINHLMRLPAEKKDKKSKETTE